MTIAIGVRKRGEVGFNRFWESLLVMPKPSYHYIPAHGYSAAEAVRHIFRKALAQADVTHVWLLDDDAYIASGTLQRLMSRNLPVVMSFTFTKTFPPQPILFRAVSGTFNGMHPAYLSRGDDVRNWLDNKAIEQELNEHINDDAFVLKYDGQDLLRRVDAVGFHCTLIQRQVLEKIGEPFCDDLNGVREDFSFSEKAMQVGGVESLYVDMSVFTGHLGVVTPKPVDYEIYDVYRQMSDLKAREAQGKP